MEHHNQTKPPTTEEIYKTAYEQGVDHSIKVCEAQMQQASYLRDTSATQHIRTIILNLHKLKK